jgi:hypothetical protein
MLVRSQKEIGRGLLHRGKRRIIIDFDLETFANLRGRAKKQSTSFQEQVRLLVELGLETERLG